MKDPTKTNDHYIKLTGKANIAEELLIGENYEVKIAGTITTKTESDNNDGSHVNYYKFEPVVVEVITDKGKSIRAKDTRGSSQIFRAAVWKYWNSHPELGIDAETFYQNLMLRLIQSSSDICEMYGEVKN